MGSGRELPSKRWASFEGWDYNGMKGRLEAALRNIDKSVLLRHAERFKGQKFSMSAPFSAGQYWICFEMVAKDGSLIVARVRLPRHPEMPATVSEEDEAYAIRCEVSAMDFVRTKLRSIPVPQVYAFEGRGSRYASEAGAVYMLLEGFHGNTLQDVESDMCGLQQEHIMAQWTQIQAELATLTAPTIASISSLSEHHEPVFGTLAASFSGELDSAGPFSAANEYFSALADTAINKLEGFSLLGAVIFRSIIEKTSLFESAGPFPLNHMDLGAQNILVNDNLDFIAIIDWEFAQTAPCQVNHNPMPFPLLGLDIEDILSDPNHIAYKNVLPQSISRGIYKHKFKETEERLQSQGRELKGSFLDALDGNASRIFACFTNLGRLPAADEDLGRQMVRLAFGLQGEEAEKYIREVTRKGVDA